MTRVVMVAPTTQELQQLTVEHHNVLSALYSGLKYQGIAEALNIPLGTVRSRINRARGALAALRAKAGAAQ